MGLDDVQRNWDGFGKTDPLWAVLTLPEKKGQKWQVDEFFETGKAEIARLMGELKALSMDVNHARVLDFGCGVGRLSQALAERFDDVTGVDIAPSMIEKAREFNRWGNRCTYALNETNDLARFGSNTFDLVYSNIVLQHMHPEYTERYLGEFMRVLVPGGALVFQLPCIYVPIRSFREMARVVSPPAVKRLYRKARYGGAEEPLKMETHAMRSNRVVHVLETNGGRVVHIRRDPQFDHRWISLIYYVTK
jgi:SAM-dependent methyltransferase